MGEDTINTKEIHTNTQIQTRKSTNTHKYKYGAGSGFYSSKSPGAVGEDNAVSQDGGHHLASTDAAAVIQIHTLEIYVKQIHQKYIH